MEVKTEFYIAKKSCGCVVVASVIDDRWRKETAMDVAVWIKDGYTVEHVDAEYVRLNLKSCKCGKQEELFKG